MARVENAKESVSINPTTNCATVKAREGGRGVNAGTGPRTTCANARRDVGAKGQHTYARLSGEARASPLLFGRRLESVI